MADFERLTRPRPVRSPALRAIERALADYGDDRAVIVHLNDVFSLPRYLMGMEHLLLAIAADPELVQALVDMSVEHQSRHSPANWCARGVQIVYTGDDYAYNTGPLMSPRHFRKLFAPACSG